MPRHDRAHVMHTLDSSDIDRLLPMRDAIDVAADALRAISSGLGEYPPRTHVALANGDALVMPGYDGQRQFGVKVATIHPGNAAAGKPGTRASYLLIDATDGEPKLLCDGTALTALRTGAVSGLATRRLARSDANVLALFGVGSQAPAQVEAVCAVRPISEMRIVSRDSERAARFVSAMRLRFPHMTIDRAGAKEAVSGASIVVTATNSSRPLFATDWVDPGTHVNAIGSFRPHMCELDPELLGRATVYVDQRASALSEAGEVVEAIGLGLVDSQSLIELGRCSEHSRRSSREITVFKTVGHAALDLFTAVELLRRAATCD